MAGRKGNLHPLTVILIIELKKGDEAGIFRNPRRLRKGSGKGARRK